MTYLTLRIKKSLEFVAIRSYYTPPSDDNGRYHNLTLRINMIAKLERTHSNVQQNMEQTQNPTMGATSNNESTTNQQQQNRRRSLRMQKLSLGALIMKQKLLEPEFVEAKVTGACSFWFYEGSIGHNVQNTVWSILSISIPNPSPVDHSGSVDGVLDWGSNGC